MDNWAYMVLFLLGVEHTEESLRKFLRTSDQWWIRTLVKNPDAKNDPYIRGKIRELIRNKIKNGCVGEILLRGNFQILLGDPYAMMQAICGLEPTGLLKAGEYYSNFWNEREVGLVNLARSPQTFRSENVLAKLVKTEETEKWYRYLKTGVILNNHGHEVVNLGGADFDGDLVSSTDHPTVTKCVYQDELTVAYDVPKPKKQVPKEEDLWEADLFSFGSIIGGITNKGTNAYALLPLLEEEYGKDSEEVKLVTSRLKQGCVAQSRQIDMYMSHYAGMRIENAVNAQMCGVLLTETVPQEMAA